MIKSFDKQNLKQLRADIDAAFAAIRQKHGVALSIGNISYNPEKATSRLTMVAIGVSGGNATTTADAKKTIAEAGFKRECKNYGLKPEHLGATITYGGERYRLDGMAGGNSWKYVFTATRLKDGKQYRLPEAAVRELQGKDYKPLSQLFGGAATPTASGMCSNENAYDEKFNPIGKCNRPATTARKEGFGRHAKMQPFCNRCAELIDEARAEAEAEARMS